MSLLYAPVFNSSRFDDFFKWWLCDQTGFVATKTSQLVDVAAQAKEDASGKSALQNCFLDVKLKDVHILALSKDELTLAVCAGDQTVYLYDVPSLVHKVRISSQHGTHSQFPLTCILFVGSYLMACRHIPMGFFFPLLHLIEALKLELVQFVVSIDKQ